MDEETLRDMRARWQEFKRDQPHWGEGEDEEKKFAWFCELELLGFERVQALLAQGYFSESTPRGHC